MKWLRLLLGAAVAGVLALAVYLFRPLAHAPEPASFECSDLSQGTYVAMQPPGHAYGVGLSYAAHIAETASSFDPDTPPPVFEKAASALATDGDRVPIPSGDAIRARAGRLEPGLDARIRDELGDLDPLLDYETELGFVLLEDVNPTALRRTDYAPKVGFFIANDLSARSLAILGEGQPNRYEYWGASKSFPGFLPVGTKAWVPLESRPNGLPCIEIRSLVNGEVRQRENTQNLIYTPVEMLRFIAAKYPGRALRQGDIVLTGTPGGVAAHVPRHLLRLANLVGLDRFRKLEAALGRDRSKFLSDGDVVVVEADGLGSVSVHITAVGPHEAPTSGRQPRRW